MLALQIFAIAGLAILVLVQAQKAAVPGRGVSGLILLACVGLFSFGAYRQHASGGETTRALGEAREAESRFCRDLQGLLMQFQGDVKGEQLTKQDPGEHDERPFPLTSLSHQVQGADMFVSSASAFCVRHAGHDVQQQVGRMGGSLGAARTLEDLDQRLVELQAMLQKYPPVAEQR